MNPDAFAKTHAHAFPLGKNWAAPEFETYFTRETTVVGGDQTSFVIGTIVLDEAEILTVATDPASQRKGLGRKALANFLDKAENRGVTRVFLEVAADNQSALALYHAAGFDTVGRRQAYYRRENAQSCDAIIMQINLPLRYSAKPSKINP